MLEQAEGVTESMLRELERDPAGDSISAAVIGEKPGLSQRIRQLLDAAALHVRATVLGREELIRELPRGDVDALVCVEPPVVAVEELRAVLPHCRVVVVGGPTSRPQLRKLLDAGAAGFVFDWQIGAALAPTVRAACSGQISVPATLAGNVERRALTRRQRDVLLRAAGGCSNAEIAHDLYLSESTVKAHLSAAFAKLGVTSRSEASALTLDPEARRTLGLGDAIRVAPI